MSTSGIGARVERVEDERYLKGLGRFVADIQLPGMLEASFVRSTIAHGLITQIQIPADLRAQVFTGEHLSKLGSIGADSTLPGFQSSFFPAIAREKVRYVGETVAVCVAKDRACAEDLATQVAVEYSPLPGLATMTAAIDPSAPLLHNEWPSNINLAGEIGEELADDLAPVCVQRNFVTARQCMVPLEGRGVVAQWDEGRQQLTVHTSTQIPHLIRRALAETLGLKQRQVRVIAPDVGGGFGLKLVLQPEEVSVCWLAMKLRRPIRWIEDRREHLTVGANARQHEYRVKAYAQTDGKLVGIDVEIDVDAGAYSMWPFTSCFEAAQAGASFPGPYRFDHYHARTRTVMTNKPPLQPYRGVSRTGICFALELTIDALAREVGIEPAELRKRNLVNASDMPFTNVVGKIFDSGDYQASVTTAAEMIGLATVRQAQQQSRQDGRLLGVGFGSYTEQTSHGTKVFAGVGIPIVPGHEQARIRLTPDGSFEVMTGLQSHGQSLETTLAQIASEVLGAPINDIKIIHGDTGETPFSTGTYASRSIVWGGGAVDAASRTLSKRLKAIAGALLNCEASDVVLDDGKLRSREREVSLADLASVWYDAPEELSPDLTDQPLEAVGTYKPTSDHGAFSYATHAATVLVDPDLGAVEILDYVIADDCGRQVNPMVVEGQTIGGTVQGIGTALYEESPYDDNAIPQALNFAQYRIPSALEVPNIKLRSTESASPRTAYGIKGVGEGGAVSPPAAIINAINDALVGYGVEILETPATPERIFQALQQAQASKK
ncbi:MAG: xanthine dehydrogenase family protein molybdopterin-binding subunit [Pseudomonadota bacterium]